MGIPVSPTWRCRTSAGLLDHFWQEANPHAGLGLGIDIKGVTRKAMAILEGDDGPGNVRERMGHPKALRGEGGPDSVGPSRAP